MFQQLSTLPPDPILGLSQAFAEDTRSQKVDLGVGVYRDAEGRTPVMAAVHAAEAILLEQQTSKAYLPPAGTPGFRRAMETQLFGQHHAALPRLRTVPTPGGCGALRLGAELLARSRPEAKVWMSAPTWANHKPLMSAAGLELAEYPYFDSATGGVDFAAMEAALRAVPAGDVVLLHACCHNPTGADLSPEQWDQVAAIAVECGWLPFVDCAYQGLGDGLEADAYGLRKLADSVPEMLLANSCSKNYGLYRERAGSLSVLADSPEQAAVVQSHLCQIARGIYSMPPAHGAAIVEMIGCDSELHQQWSSELAAMQQRMKGLRLGFVAACQEAGLGDRFDFIADQKGMFSYLGISAAEVEQMRAQHAVYLLGSSRINVAGMSEQNMSYLARALAGVLG